MPNAGLESLKGELRAMEDGFSARAVCQRLEAAIPMENPYCSCKARASFNATAYSCDPYGESLLQL